MKNKAIKVLLIEDNTGDICLMRETLKDIGSDKFELIHADRLSKGLEYLAGGEIDVVLLDLGLPDSQWVETFTKVHAQAPEVPVVILTSNDDVEFAFRAVQEGAQDYLVKQNVTSDVVARVLRYAIERHKIKEGLRNMAFIDELTGLYNRRGLTNLAAHHLKMANRAKKKCLLVYGDMDNMKMINDTYGHQEGDIALVNMADILKKSFRTSDVIARVGGDEFVALVIEADDDSGDAIHARLEENIRNFNMHSGKEYKISICKGTALYIPNTKTGIEELISIADSELYKEKQKKREHDFKGKTTGLVQENLNMEDTNRGIEKCVDVLKSNKELKRLTNELVHSNAEMEHFAYVASHDLQEPLRMVTSYLQLIKRRYGGKLDENADEFINFALDGAQRMQILLNDLLRYSRIGAVKGNGTELTDSSSVLDAVLANLNEAIDKSKAVITVGSLPPIIADSLHLAQLFQNLIDNAIKFCSNKIPEIHIKAEDKDNKWLFSVRDNGIGINPQYFERIFVIFQRLHTKSEYSGTGVGLAICKKIVELYGGNIWVESKEGEGSTFYFTIPKDMNI